jgi:hypothetical protein
MTRKEKELDQINSTIKKLYELRALVLEGPDNTTDIVPLDDIVQPPPPKPHDPQ